MSTTAVKGPEVGGYYYSVLEKKEAQDKVKTLKLGQIWTEIDKVAQGQDSDVFTPREGLVREAKGLGYFGQMFEAVRIFVNVNLPSIFSKVYENTIGKVGDFAGKFVDKIAGTFSPSNMIGGALNSYGDTLATSIEAKAAAQLQEKDKAITPHESALDDPREEIKAERAKKK